MKDKIDYELIINDTLVYVFWKLPLKILKKLFWISQVLFLATFNIPIVLYLHNRVDWEKGLMLNFLLSILIIIIGIIAFVHLIFYMAYLFNEDMSISRPSYTIKYPLLDYLEGTIEEVKNLLGKISIPDKYKY